MAQEINWKDRKDRNDLINVLPLETPFSIVLEVIKACNFKCVYCEYSNKRIPKYEKIDLYSFNKIIEDLQRFKSKLKSFQFVGLGEPLLNNDIYEMFKLIKDYTESITLITNGSLLNKTNIDKIFDTPLNEIRISLQGITEEDYYNVANYKINFQKFIENISYLYRNKKDSLKLYLKIADIAIDTEDKRKRFYDIYGDIADFLIIEKIYPLYNTVDYTNIVSDVSKGVAFNELPEYINICPQLFFIMQILSNGDVAPCCSLNMEKPIIGNIFNQSLYDIWNGNIMKKLRIDMIQGKRNDMKYCNFCNFPEYEYNKYDYLDDNKEKLLKIYNV